MNEALDNYCEVIEKAPSIVAAALRSLSSELLQDLIPIEHASHWAVVLQAALYHTVSAKQKGWQLSTTTNKNTMELTGLTPYWLSRYSSAKNNINLDGIFLLTAPNMSGKSTLMRSVLVTALLGNSLTH